MEQNINYPYSNCVVTHKGEFFGITCLAIIGVVSIMKSVANGAYRTGRDTKEREMKKDFKKYMKTFKKNGP